MSNEKVTYIPPVRPCGVVWRIHWDKIEPESETVTIDSNGDVFSWAFVPTHAPIAHDSFGLWAAWGLGFGAARRIFNIGPRKDWQKLIFERPREKPN